MSEQQMIKKLEALLAKMSAEKLDAKGEQELLNLLRGSEEARAYYFDFCELSTCLEEDQELYRDLVEDRLPQNVVSLSDQPLRKTVASAQLPEDGMGMSRDWWLAAAAAVAVTLLALTFLAGSQVGEDSLDLVDQASPVAEGASNQLPAVSLAPVLAVPSDVDDSAAKVVDRVELAKSEPIKPLIEVQPEAAEKEAPHDSNPMDKYESMLLTAVAPGNLKRPPTPFSNDQVGSKKVSFNRDIRPLLSDNCYHCHGPDKGSREAELRLDLPDQVFADRGKDKPFLIKRGDPAKSDLYRRLIARDPDDLMPPEDSHKVMKPQQIAKIKKWIEQGAEWESHWAFIVPKKEPLPSVKGKWGVNEIDRFVLASLEEEGMRPSPEADRRTQIRRATFDATGLPPTTEEVEVFLSDRSANAYEKLIDRLLDSPRYGEHRARYWLDAARYGDTHGLHLDNYRSIWPYRDWVIKAFNDNMPFDQFTIEQLAGDLLPNATQDQLVATGFNRCNVTTSEGGAIAEEFLSRYAIDRVSTTGSIWLGLTLGCTQCHDHKFDPIKQKEFYQMVAYFNNTTQPGMDKNSIESAPSIRVYPSKKVEEQSKHLQQQIAAAGGKLKQIKKKNKAAFELWRKNEGEVKKAFEELSFAGAVLEKAVSVDGESGAVNLGGIANFNQSQPFSISLHLKVPAEPGRAVVLSRVDPAKGMRGYRLIWEDQGLVLELIEQWPGRMIRRGTTRRFKEGAAADVVVTYDGSGSSQGIRFFINGKFPGSRVYRDWVDTMEGDNKAANASLMVGGKSGEDKAVQVEHLQIYDRCLTELEALLIKQNEKSLTAMAKKKELKGDDEKILSEWYNLSSDAEYKKTFYAKSEFENQKSKILSLVPLTLVWEEKKEEPFAYVLDRGEYDKHKEKVTPGVPKVLNALPEGAAKNRLGLARWIVDPENPLTARVTVNRFWGELFGTGLVKTAGDFGAQGVSPTHPDLLDWLALTLVEKKWDVKALYKEILMSATYRQSSRVTPELREKDPQNIWLARGPRFRLDAEMIRDQALLAGDVLVNKIGGPAVKPYQPKGLWGAVGYTSSNTQTFSQDYGKAAYRRSIYTFIKRTSPPPNMSLFNAPNRESCVISRERTNTPLQALVLMNDPQYVDAARHLAVRTVRSGKSLDERLAFMSTILLARPLSGDDLAIMKDSYQKFEKSYAQDPAAAKDLLGPMANAGGGAGGVEQLASWVMLANQMLNLDEVINKN
ncbi:MAG: PSD1 and planctomycete cytochrome C domain-containing protein [Verrucomicrobiales bacterium]|nr:PSD1 and planctomycete cytochrome C domain-containing protein [Verrucomicrobiales bacterium]